MKLKPVHFLIILFTLIGSGSFYYYIAIFSKKLPDYIAVSNGRIEAQAIDVATRSGGRILTIPVEEGQMVNAGDVVATLDLQYLAEALEGAKANVRSSIQQQEEAASRVKEAESALELARKEYARSSKLVENGAISRSRNDQIYSQKQTAIASLAAAKQRLQAAKEAVGSAQAEVRRQQELLSDQYLTAPKTGRILYKLAEPGEVIAAGGKAITLLDLTDVYMTVFFPTSIVGKLRLGDEARIILDAFPDTAIPANISYVSPEAQFTPREVETRSEREKMTFRVKVRIPPALLKKYLEAVKTGLPGEAYVRTQKDAQWPDFLIVKPELQAIIEE